MAAIFELLDSAAIPCSNLFMAAADNISSSLPVMPLEVSDYVVFNEDGTGVADDRGYSHQKEIDQSIKMSETNFGSGKRMKMDGSRRIGFRTKSEVDVLDDGYKWRKYGKKSVKNSPNKRNYYKCSREGCSVKKRVERDSEDNSYVITTYDGVHNHAISGVVCLYPDGDSIGNYSWASTIDHSIHRSGQMDTNLWNSSCFDLSFL